MRNNVAAIVSKAVPVGKVSRAARSLFSLLMIAVLLAPPMTVTPALAAPPDDCALRSALVCADIPVSLPFSLDWNADAGALPDATGIGTGFTMIDPPSARLAADGPVFDGDAPGYEPSKLAVNTTAGTLTIVSNKGIMFAKPSISTETNSQINALGVGVDVGSDALELRATLFPPAWPSGANSSQQAGLWFGLNEDNYVKLAFVNSSPGSGGRTASINLQSEDDPTVAPTTNITSSPFAWTGGTPVQLVLVLNPTDNTARGTYQVGSGVVQPIGPLTLPSEFF
ncbi:hypothetical protein HC891_22025 [Candidatus Gracilibacteria bacterium]|nr:hypothetical protein [Candidatus Gracilibacteria bacterium]